VAAIGMAAGAGMIVIAVIGTALILIVLALLDRVEALARRIMRLPPEQLAPAPDPVDDGRAEDLL
jgi:uncharacterized membrane protein YhiD involved in acid resistance